MARKKKVTVARGVKVARGKEEKMRERKGSSNTGKYKNVSPKEFAGAKGGASKYSFPINTLARARNALARAHFAPNPEGIKKAVYAKYPELKKRAVERKGPKKTSSKSSSPKRKSLPKGKASSAQESRAGKKAVRVLRKDIKAGKGERKVEKVMHEWKEGALHSGSKRGPKVKSRKQAIAIALSEARRAKGKKKK